MNYNEIEKTPAIPEAASLIETFRAIGYNIETAIADIIDNSISANAKNIYFNSEWRGDRSIITILDDGDGMNAPELVKAMRPGTQNPLENRADNDLGRFGLGLKTASFSQCRMLTVLSKRKGYKPVFQTWDLDYVNQTSRWDLLRYIPDEFKNKLDNAESGTLVIWSNLDRIIPLGTIQSDVIAKEKFLQSMERVKDHVAMIFHRFIEENICDIHCWNRKVKPWNPFLLSKSSAEADQYEANGVFLKGFVLPHKTRISDYEYKDAGGINGWNMQQGFYVYRGKRLLIAGDWLGLFRSKELHYQLARIIIEIPNKLDSDWQIDIKKSTARIPFAYRDSIKSYATAVRNKAQEVFRHRGKILTIRNSVEYEPLWKEKTKNNKWSFIINRDNSIVKEAKEMAKKNPDKAINTLLSFIEETLPINTLFIKISKAYESKQKLAKNNDLIEQPSLPFEGVNKDIMIPMIKKIIKNQIEIGKSIDEAKKYINSVEPLNLFPELIESIEL